MVEKFIVADYKTGLETDKEPWLLPADAFTKLEGMYVWRGRVRRQVGYKFLGQMVSSNGVFNNNLDGGGDFGGNLGASPIARGSVRVNFIGVGPEPHTYTDDFQRNLILNPPVALTITGITQAVSARVTTSVAHGMAIGDLVRITGVNGMSEINNTNYTITGVPSATEIDINVNSTGFSTYVNSGNVNWVGTVNYTTGAFTISSSAINAGIAFTASFGVQIEEPVMGMGIREVPGTNFEDLIVFNQTRANLYDAATNLFLDITSTPWSGGNADFFWTANYYFSIVGPSKTNLFWATNNVIADQIKYYDGTAWTNFSPTVRTTGPVILTTCKVIIQYKDRLLAFNTTENDGVNDFNFQNRVRYTAAFEDPTLGAAGESWEEEPGRAGFIDAPTSQAIISVEFIHDNLLVFFEHSTWRLAYTANISEPFSFERINTDYGCESMNSVISFDKEVLAVGDKGIIYAALNSVQRLDEKIPDTVFEIQNQNNGNRRVWGQRDFYRELAYWTIPQFVRNDNNQNQIFPNQILCYNYREQSYSFFNGTFTALGSVQLFNSRRWISSLFPWASANFTWKNPINQARFPLVCAGNQQGMVHFFDDDISNSFCLYVSGITKAAKARVTSTNHNLEIGAVISFDDVEGMTEINGLRVVVDEIINANEFDINLDTTGAGFTLYTGGGVITCYYNFRAKTKRSNPFIQEDKSVQFQHIDFYLEETTEGEFTLNVYVDQNDSTPMPNLFTGQTNYTISTASTQTFLGNTQQDKVWVRVPCHATGQFIQFELFLSDAQMLNPTTQFSQVTLHGMIVNSEPHGRLI